MATQIRKIGNSVGAIIPAVLLKKVGLAEGDTIDISEEGGRLIIQSVRVMPKYNLADLLKKCNPKAPQIDEVADWELAAPVGNER